jgi:hypothetical protein
MTTAGKKMTATSVGCSLLGGFTALIVWAAPDTEAGPTMAVKIAQSASSKSAWYLPKANMPVRIYIRPAPPSKYTSSYGGGWKEIWMDPEKFAQELPLAENLTR